MDGSPSSVMDPPANGLAPEDGGLGPAGSDPAEAAEPQGQQSTPEPSDEVAAAEPPTPPAALPDDGQGEDPEAEGQLFLIGNRQLGVKVGGRKPDATTLKYKGAQIDVSGQFDREDTLLMVDLWQVTGDNDQDTIEKPTGRVKSTSKSQNATLRSAVPLKEYLEVRMADHPEVLRIVLTALEMDDEA